MRGSYPDARFLSRCAVPIQMRGSYPDAPFLSRCAVPIQMRRSYPDAWFLSRYVRKVIHRVPIPYQLYPQATI